MAEADYPYVYSWGVGDCGDRKGQRCKIIGKRKPWASIIVIEFMDAQRFVVARASLHRARGAC